ncbi:MAG: 4Fe-4S dicluster domain-containing protein, partial [Opitutales bacterium]
MRHQIPIDSLGAAGSLMGDAVQACVHCGFCLPTCPTYDPLGQEMDTPRGRIVLMKETLEGTLPLKDAMPHVDRCLGCLACETSCPSGVSFRALLGPFREKAARERKVLFTDRMLRHFTLGSFTRPILFRQLAKVAFLVKPLR